VLSSAIFSIGAESSLVDDAPVNFSKNDFAIYLYFTDRSKFINFFKH
jgi:hypothetical protein